jgi:ATP-dependent RNA helicase DDX19/DBP5
LIAQSQSGSGKTLCFVLAMISAVDCNRNTTQAICIAPTLELSEQIANVAQRIAKYNLKLNIALCASESLRKFETTPHIIVGIPGVVYSLIKKKVIITDSVKLFAIDEVDHILDESNNNVKDNTIRVKKLLDKDCIYMLFTATFEDSDIDETKDENETKKKKEKTMRVQKFCQDIVDDSEWPCHTILAPKEELTVKSMTQCMVKCPDSYAKDQVIALVCQEVLAKNNRQIIIFVNRTDDVQELPHKLKKLGVAIDIGTITASMGAQERRSCFNKFQEGRYRVLVSTNYIARGIDVAKVACVINYDMPMKNNHDANNTVYLHRVGRTARFGRRGCAINLAKDRGDTAIVEDIAKHFDVNIQDVSSSGLVSFIEEALYEHTN